MISSMSWSQSICFDFLLLLQVLFHHPASRQMFELICVYAERFSNVIPVTFLTGFYVSQVVSRWWDQFMSLPWPDKIALKLVSFCPGTVCFSEYSFRRAIVFVVNCFNSICKYWWNFFKQLGLPILFMYLPSKPSFLNEYQLLKQTVLGST